MFAATNTDHFGTPQHGAILQIHILTVESLPAGKKPRLPALLPGERTCKKGHQNESAIAHDGLFRTGLPKRTLPLHTSSGIVLEW